MTHRYIALTLWHSEGYHIKSGCGQRSKLKNGSVTGRGHTIADLMKERKTDVLCERETRWTGNKAKELGDGFKLIYRGANKEKRNGIGIILSKDLKDLVTEVKRRNERIMWVRFSFDEFPVNIVSVLHHKQEVQRRKRSSFGQLCRRNWKK